MESDGKIPRFRAGRSAQQQEVQAGNSQPANIQKRIRTEGSKGNKGDQARAWDEGWSPTAKSPGFALDVQPNNKRCKPETLNQRTYRRGFEQKVAKVTKG